MNIIESCYLKIFGHPPVGLKTWEIAREVILGFDGAVLGEELARDFLENLISYVWFPDRESTAAIVGRAEEMLAEVSDDYLPNKEVHMADVTYAMWRRELG